jgi:hypothetical protein
MSDRRTPQEKKAHDDYVRRRWERITEFTNEQQRKSFNELNPPPIKSDPFPVEKGNTWLGLLVEGIFFKKSKRAPSKNILAKTEDRREPDELNHAMKRVPGWTLATCTIVGGLIGLGIGTSSGATGAALDAFLGAFIGLLTIPAIIKYKRVLTLAAIIGVVIWLATHSRS